MAEKKIEKLKLLTQKIVKEYKPDKIILFGSYAWGNPGPDSDVDLFIVKESEKRRFDREVQVRRMLFDIQVPVDILVYTPSEVKKRLSMEDFFVEDIISRGEVLYEKN